MISHKPLFEKQKRQAGQGLVEFTLTLPILLLILIGIIDIGRLTASYVILTNAAREGARYGAAYPTDDENIEKRIQGEVDGSIVVANQIAQTKTCSPNCGVGNSIQVQVTYPFQFITTYIFADIQTLDIKAQATFQITK